MLPRQTLTKLCPYTTLFRSQAAVRLAQCRKQPADAPEREVEPLGVERHQPLYGALGGSGGHRRFRKGLWRVLSLCLGGVILGRERRRSRYPLQGPAPRRELPLPPPSRPCPRALSAAS